MDLTQVPTSSYNKAGQTENISPLISQPCTDSAPILQSGPPLVSNTPTTNESDSNSLCDTPTKRLKTECDPQQFAVVNTEDSMSEDSVGAGTGYTHKVKKTWLQRHTTDGARHQSYSIDTGNDVKSESVDQVKISQIPTSIEAIDACINSVVEQTRQYAAAECKSSSISSATLSANIGSMLPNSSAIASAETKPKQLIEPVKTELVSSANGMSSIETHTLPVTLPSTIKVQHKKSAPSVATQIRKKLISQRPPLTTLKRTCASFVQNLFCSRYDRVNRLPRCRECRMRPGALEDLWSDGGSSPSSTSSSPPSSPPGASHVAEDDGENIYCRFVAFRKLRYTRSGLLVVAGFCNPKQDADSEDRRLWLPATSPTLRPLTAYRRQLSRLLLRHVGAQFCRLVEQEEEAMASSSSTCDPASSRGVVAWKRVVPGCREMCDVCETTLFNTHWVCGKCGFAMCPDCYVIWRKSADSCDGSSAGTIGPIQAPQWLPCNNRQNHTPDRMMLTCIIAGDALQTLNRRVHSARRQAGLAACHCSEAQRQQTADPPAPEIGADVGAGYTSSDSGGSSSDSGNRCDDGNALRQLLGVDIVTPSTVSSDCSTSTPATVPVAPVTAQPPPHPTMMRIRSPDSGSDEESACGERVRVMTLTESRQRFPLVAHSWLCDGKLLLLEDGGASTPSSTSFSSSAAVDREQQQRERLFRDQWRCGQPVLCSGVGGRLQRQDLWTVDAFQSQFGHLRHDLINCTTGNVVPGQLMRDFWLGFGRLAHRLRDDSGQPMILKLKDWPPGEDFSDLMPERFADLMRALPMPEYTRRDGRLNLASCLPDAFVPPDLGPKMYIAYGCAHRPDRASTNLHLDVSDAVNIIVHVSIPEDEHPGGGDGGDTAALAAIDQAGCDPLTKRRARENRPGALWHIYRAADADRIRDLLNRVALERGDRLEARHDPIHDQSWYLDGPLRQRLYAEYGVEGFPIVQCSGDALFVPAGAPHQVRNLHSCIKVAEDFVSPENVGHCFDLTQEFRSLSDTHTNHEDKLQIKNIVYHAMKEVVSYWPE